MTRVRKSSASALAFDAIAVEGALIAPTMLARIAQHQAGAQSEADYGIPKGLTLRDEIARYFRIGQAMFREFAASETPSPAATLNLVEKLLRDVFGLSDIGRIRTRMIGERQFTISLEALGGRVPVVVVPAADDLDRPSPQLTADGHRQSAASALQSWLNAHEGALWGLCANGNLLRLLRDNSSLTRPAYIEADLRRIFEADAFSDFAALWLLIHSSRFGIAGAPRSDCALERWRTAGQTEGVAARDKLRDGVEAALLSLGNGFLSHSANSTLREQLHTGVLPLPEFFGELLRLVYRLIFLLAAEDRNLLHPPDVPAGLRKLYAEGYSVGALRDRAVRRAAWNQHHDHWEGLLITFAALVCGEKRLGLPALGGLFAPDAIPHLEATRLSNRSLMDAIFRLAWLREDSGLVPVNWRDMETEELGSVYEGLLELTPRLINEGRGFDFAEGGEAKGHARKTSGSYYTPDSLVQTLLDSALDPVLDRVEAEADDPAKALLSVTVIDPACGSGHFLLAAARRIATRLARVRMGGVAAPADHRHALRDVARACIHGVDRNPMAIELTKVALWIETVEPGKPLGFLDASIRCGDALFGLFDLKVLERGIPDDAYKPLSGDDKETAKHFLARNRAERAGQGSLDFGRGGGGLPAAAPMVGEAKALRAMPEDSPEEIAAKRSRFESARADPRHWETRVAADLYVAAFLAPKTGGVPTNRNAVTIPTTAHIWDALAGRTIYGPLIDHAQNLAGVARAFHWPWEFPDVMAAGGFDIALGNPPWERIKLQEQEFFASRDPVIAQAPNAASRRRLIARLKDSASDSREFMLYHEFEAAKRAADASSTFARIDGEDGGRFALTGQGDVNTYALFAELFTHLTSKRGRAGIIIPSGLATDNTTKDFFGALISNQTLVSFFEFENEGFFPAAGQGHMLRFALTTIVGAGQRIEKVRFLFQGKRLTDMVNPDRIFTLSPDDIFLVSPNTKTCPIFHSKYDALLTKAIYERVPVLVREADSTGSGRNSWGMRFMAMFHMANASHLFRTKRDLERQHFILKGNHFIRGADCYLPLYEAKMMYLYSHRHGDFRDADNLRAHVLPAIPTSRLQQHSYVPESYYWVSDAEVSHRLSEMDWPFKWLLGWRKITDSRASARTLIFSLLPYSGAGDSLNLMFPKPLGRKRLYAGLVANLSSIILDYVVRTKVGGLNLNYFAMRQFPILAPESYTDADLNFIVPIR